MMTTKPLCWVPYYSLELTHLGAKVCCKFHGADWPYSNIEQFRSAKADQWRQEQFHAEQLPQACSACVTGKTVHNYRAFSHREFQQQGWTQPITAELRKLEIALDNVCKSTCIPCHSSQSSSIANLFKVRGLDTYGDKVTGQVDIESLRGQLGFLERLMIFGGEPLISPQLEQFVDLLLVESPRLKVVSITTGLNSIKQKNIDCLKLLAKRGCKIYCNLSIDAEPELNAWIRGHTIDSFDQSLEKLQLARSYIHLQRFQPTIGIYNVFALPEYIKYLENLVQTFRIQFPVILSNVITKPQDLHPKQLPLQFKELVKQKLTLARDSLPHWGQSMINTALVACLQDSTVPWTQALSRVNQFPLWRGSTKTWQDQWDHYVNPTLI